jgi:hypothetical protein
VLFLLKKKKKKFSFLLLDISWSPKPDVKKKYRKERKKEEEKKEKKKEKSKKKNKSCHVENAEKKQYQDPTINTINVVPGM